MLIILRVTVKTGRRSDAPNMGVHLMVISDSRHYIHAAKPS